MDKRTLCALFLASLLALPGRAADFYEGKTVTIIVGFSAAGGFDLTGRLLARHLPDHLPGKPTMIVQNMPGAGSLLATNHLYNAAPQDGTVLGIIGGGEVLEPLLGNPQAKFDPRRFGWIGSHSREFNLCTVWHTVPVRTVADAKQREITVGTTGPGSRTMNYPLAANAILGTRFKLVAGYPGGNELSLAMEKGETEGYCGWSWAAIRQRNLDWVRDGKVRFLMQFSLTKLPDLPDVPLAIDLAPTESDRQVMRFLLTDTVLAWPFVAPPGLPPERLALLRAAYEAALRDPQLRQEAAKAALDIDPVSGARMQELVENLYRVPPSVVERTRAILAGK